MADTLQHGSISGSASVRQGISGEITIGGKIMKELRFLPYSEFPEIGREETLYIDTDNNAMYYYNGSTYVALSGGGGGGTDNYNALTNKPSVNSVTLIGNKTSSELGLQELIADLSTIRSGAASGSTAVQPETLETALSEKQDVINDLDDIRSGASAGATAVQPSGMEAALADKQDVINDLDAIRSGATAGNTALQPEDIDTLPTDGSSNPVSSGGTYNFVNSSIATNTAYFIGTFASVAELEAYTGTVTNNDYAFVTSTDSAGNTLYNRYKYNAATQEWSFEYAVNNTAFTAAQWAAIQSGLTASDKTKLDGIEQGANKTVIDASPTSGSSNAVSSGGVHTALSGKQDTISDLSDIRSGASAGATAVQPSALNDYQTKLSGTNKLDPAYIEYDATHRAVSDTEKSTWNGKQDTISDLAEIRSGAAAGSTAVQQTAFETDQQRQETEIGAVANRGAKNLLKFRGDTTSSSAGNVYAKINADGTLSVGLTSGTTATAQLTFTLGAITNYRDRKLILSGCPAGGNYQSGYALYVSNDGGTAQADTGSGATIPIVTGVTSSVVALMVRSGTTISSELTFRPMVRDASITDATFQPYADTNPVLTQEVNWNVNQGVKNLIDIQHPSGTKNTNYVTTSDGGVELSCSNATWTQYNIADIPVASGSEYTFIFYVDTISGTDKLQVFVRDTNSSGTTLYNSVTISATGTYTATITPPASKIWVGIYLNNSATAKTASAKIRVMLCPAIIKDPTFQPYALSNPVLTHAAIKAVDEGAKNVAQTNDVTKTGDGFVNTDPISGDLIVSAATVSTTASSSTFAVVFYYTDGTISTSKQLPITNSLVYEFNTGEKVVERVRIFAGNTTEASSKKTITLTNFMICTAADWAISQKFVPYAPTNRELYETGQSCYDFIFGVGTTLQSYDDLNNYKNPGKVQAANGAIAATIANTPWTQSGFTAITIPNLTLASCMQFVLPNTMAGKWYRRRYMQNIWSPWTEYDGTQVTTT